MIESGDSKGTLSRSKSATSTEQRDQAREAIETLLVEQGTMKLKDIVSATGLSTKAVHDVVYRDPGRIQKVSWGTYGLTGVVGQTEASAS